MLELELLAQFLFGVGGALVLIYLRIFEALPRMSGVKEIKLKESKLEEHSKKWKELAKKYEKSINSPFDKLLRAYHIKENELKNEIRSLKTRQWALAAILYIVLGGLFALVVFPLVSEGKIISEGTIQSIEAVKCMAIGFTWTTYISLITGKTAEKEIIEYDKKLIDEMTKDLEKAKKNTDLTVKHERECAEKVKVIATGFNEYRKKTKELLDQYKELLE